MPIPYMGSKRKSAGKIYQTIKNLSPNYTLLVDLFCGGFAIGAYFLKQGWDVIANDKNKYVIALLEKVYKEGLDTDIVQKFIPREKFLDVLANKKKYEDWFVGFVMCCWSFGNNQKSYLYGSENERLKGAIQNFLVYKDEKFLEGVLKIPKKYIEGVLKQESLNKRRLAFNKVTRRMGLQSLESLESLQRLQSLERLQRLQRLEKVKFFSEDYSKIKVPKGAVVYCDPPYKGTAEYSEGGFNHKEFWDYVRGLSKTNPVYVSEYQAPEDFREVLSFQQSSTLGGGTNSGQPDECLFTIK